MTKEQEIQRNMELLQISREEAEQLYEDDHSDEVLPEVAEMEKKAAKIKNYTQSDKPRKKAEKVRKVDEEKGYILGEVRTLLEKLGAEGLATKTETEISFTLNENAYTIKLTKHRPPKA